MTNNTNTDGNDDSTDTARNPNDVDHGIPTGQQERSSDGYGSKRNETDPEFQPFSIGKGSDGVYVLTLVKNNNAHLQIRRTPEQLALMASSINDTLANDGVEIPEV